LAEEPPPFLSSLYVVVIEDSCEELEVPEPCGFAG
jgi:hypothetical protein